MEKKNITYQAICRVSEHGTLEPTFIIGGGHTSGLLKYFTPLGGKKVRVTIEVLDDEKNISSLS